jgi:hypothetical protein
MYIIIIIAVPFVQIFAAPVPATRAAGAFMSIRSRFEDALRERIRGVPAAGNRL